MGSQLSKFFSNSILRSRSNFLLLVMVRTPFLSVAFLKDPFLLRNRCLTALFALFFRVSTLFYSFKLFRVSGVYLIFRRLLFFTLTFLSSANFFRVKSFSFAPLAGCGILMRHIFCIRLRNFLPSSLDRENFCRRVFLENFSF